MLCNSNEEKYFLINDFISLIKLYLFLEKKTNHCSLNYTKSSLLSMLAAYFAFVPIRIHTFTGLIFPTKKGF